VKWNLRLAAANRGIWKASELQRMLAEAGLVIAPGRCRGWVGQPGQHQARRPGRHLRRGGLRGGRAADREPGKHARPAVTARQQAARPRRPGRRSRPGAVTAARSRPPDARTPGLRRPATSCPDCLSFGSTYGTQSYCRACYNFTRRYHRRMRQLRAIIAVRRATAAVLAAGPASRHRGRITPADFARAAATSSCHSRE